MTSPQRAATAVVEEPDAGDSECRSMRSDARRNYERLVAAAREVFNEQGAGAPMEAIAKHAGVGVGTLYRHFPKRIDIVQAVYRTDVDQLVILAEESVAKFEPWAGLVTWMQAFVRYTEGKRILLSELHEAFEKDPNLRLLTRDRIEGAMEIVIRRAQDAGLARRDINSADLMQLLAPMCMSATLSSDQGDRLLLMILDGLRVVS